MEASVMKPVSTVQAFSMYHKMSSWAPGGDHPHWQVFSVLEAGHQQTFQPAMIMKDSISNAHPLAGQS
jgi:hypothetical protein